MVKPASALQSHRRVAADEILLPPQETPKGTRGLILSAALRLIAERGYGGTSVRDIAAEAGVQPPTMYAHYPSKEHVLSELIRIGHEEHFRRFRSALLESQPGPEHQIAALVRAHVGMHAEYSMLAVVANSELHALSAAFAAPALELRKQSERTIQEVIERGVQRGVFKVPNTWLAVAAIGAMGLRVAHWYTPEFELGVDRVAEIYVQFAWRLLGHVETKQAGAGKRRGAATDT